MSYRRTRFGYTCVMVTFDVTKDRGGEDAEPVRLLDVQGRIRRGRPEL